MVQRDVALHEPRIAVHRRSLPLDNQWVSVALVGLGWWRLHSRGARA
jgi:hypothetical protein